MKRSIIFMLVCGLALTACSSDDSEINNTEEEETTVEETREDVFIQETAVEEELVEPSGTMEEWGDYTDEEKLAKIEESLIYIQEEAEEGESPIIMGTPEQFIQIIDARYDEIQGLTGENGLEKPRMNNSAIVSQVGIMGATHKLLKPWYKE